MNKMLRLSDFFFLSADASLCSRLESGMLFAVPIPEEFSASGATIERAIQEAVESARHVNFVLFLEACDYLSSPKKEIKKSFS